MVVGTTFIVRFTYLPGTHGRWRDLSVLQLSLWRSVLTIAYFDDGDNGDETLADDRENSVDGNRDRLICNHDADVNYCDSNNDNRDLQEAVV